MDKYDLVLDIIGHPEKYSPEQLEKLLSDPETKSIYEIVSLTSSAANSTNLVTPEEIDREWRRLESRLQFTETPVADEEAGKRRSAQPRFLYFFRSRAAAVAAVTLTSLVAVAIGVGMKYGFGEKESTASVTGEYQREGAVISAVAGDSAVSTLADSVAADLTPVVFENETLETLLSRIASAHGAKVLIAPSQASLRLYFKWNPAEPLDEVVARLNNFEQIDITLEGKTIKVD